MDYIYKAFLSYSHRADAPLATELQQAVQRFAKPWYRRRAVRIFRDQTDLSANPALWPTIQAALDASEFYILLASPEARTSIWVPQELAHWYERRDTSKVLFALTGGRIHWAGGVGDFDWDQTDALPPDVLRGRFAQEPLYVDLTWARSMETKLLRRDPRFLDAVATVAAPLHGQSKSELYGEDLRQHRRAIRLAVSTAISLAVLLVIAVAFGLLAKSEYEQINRRLFISELGAAYSAARNGETGQGRDILRRQSEEPGLAKLRDFAWYHLALTYRACAAEFEAPNTSTLAFSPDGASLAMGTGGGRVLLANLASGHFRELPADDSGSNQEALDASPRDSRYSPGIETLAFAPDGKQLAAGGTHDDVIHLWDVASGRSLRLRHPVPRLRRVTFRPIPPLDRGTRRLLFARGGSTLVALHGDDAITLWNIRPGVIPDPQPLSVPGAIDIYGSTDGSTLNVVTADPETGRRELRTWTLSPLRESRTQSLGERLGESLVFSADDAHVFSQLEDGTVAVWNRKSGALRYLPEFRNRSDVFRMLRDVAILPDGRTARLVFSSGEVFDYLLPTGLTVPDGSAQIPLKHHIHPMTASGRFVAVGHADGVVRLWDIDQLRRPARTLSSRFAPVEAEYAAAYGADWSPTGKDPTPDGSRIVLGGIIISRDDRPYRSTLDVFEGATGRRIAQLSGGGPGIRSVAIAPDGRTVASGGWDGTVSLWEVADRPNPRTLIRLRGPVMDLKYSQDGHHLAAVTNTRLLHNHPGAGDVCLWDLGSGRLRLHQQSSQQPTGVAFDPDGRTLAVSLAEGSVQMWDVATGRQKTALKAPPGNLWCVAFSGDGQLLAAGGHDLVWLWNVASGQLRTPISTGVDEVERMAFVTAPGVRRPLLTRLLSASVTRPVLAVATMGLSSVNLYDVQTCQPVIALHGAEGGALKSTRDGRMLWAGSHFWRAATETEAAEALAVRPTRPVAAAGTRVRPQQPQSQRPAG